MCIQIHIQYHDVCARVDLSILARHRYSCLKVYNFGKHIYSVDFIDIYFFKIYSIFNVIYKLHKANQQNSIK